MNRIFIYLKNKTLTTFGLLLFCSISYGQVTVSLSPSADAFVFNRPNSVSSNYGTTGYIATGTWTWGDQGSTRTFLKFDLSSIPAGATITNATLTLTPDVNAFVAGGNQNLANGSNASTLYPASQAWSENVITWTNQPPLPSGGLTVALPKSTSSAQVYALNVLQIVQNMVANPSTNFGFEIKQNVESIYAMLTFGSKENTNPSLRPVLSITYNCPFTVQPITGNSNVCVNQYLPLSDATAGGVWSSSNTAVATVNSYGLVTGVASGTAIINYKVTNGGCSVTVTKSVTVNSTVSFTITGPSTVCPSTSGNAYSVTPAVAGADYTWNIQNSPNVGVYFPVAGSTNSTLSFPSSVANNPVILRCYGSNACGASSIVTKSITVSSDVPPAPIITCSGGSTCPVIEVNNNGSNTIKWIVNGVVQSTASSYTRPAYASVLCTFTSPSGCTRSTWYSPAVVCTYSARMDNSSPCSTVENKGLVNPDYALKLSPNPSDGHFALETKGYGGKIIISNMMGQTVNEIAVNETSYTVDIDMSNKPKGTYLLKLTGGEKEHVVVFVVQ